jgi:hypothetical protein
MPLITALAAPLCQHFDDKTWRGSGYAVLAELTFCVSLLCCGVAVVLY